MLKIDRKVLQVATLITTLFLMANLCSEDRKLDSVATLADQFTLDRDVAKKDLKYLTKEPHPFGSKRQIEVANYLVSRSNTLGLRAISSKFSVDTPNPIFLESPNAPADFKIQITGQNVFAFTDEGSSSSCIIAIGSHYDTKIVKHTPYVGANDSGSSSVALLQILSTLNSYQKKSKTRCSFVGIWFDGEESILPNWSDGIRIHPAKIEDNTYGSRYEAGRLKPCEKDKGSFCFPKELSGKKLEALILLDLIGSKNIKITQDMNSAPRLQNLLIKIDDLLFDQSIIASHKAPISDDHIPFVKKGVPSINIIDFENLDYWHKDGDEIENISYDSIEKAAKLALALALKLGI